jgi:hypothetical protein
MDLAQLSASLSWTVVLTALVSAYALGIAIFLVLEYDGRGPVPRGALPAAAG